jgi:3-hydroxyacyl-CoA dehydrogenase
VVATEIAPNAETSLRKFVDTAWPALKRLRMSAGASQSNLKFTVDLVQAVAGVDLVQENGPERIEFKQKLYGQRDELLPRCDHRIELVGARRANQWRFIAPKSRKSSNTRVG